MAASLSASVDIVGPPELKTAAAHVEQATATSEPFLDMLHKSMTGEGLPPLGLTENGSVTFLSAGNKCLDFFFQVVPGTDPDRVEDLLEEAWKEDPLTALKLIFQLRGVRGTGKSDKKNFYTAALWLYKSHYGTLVVNARLVGAFGYYKDLLELMLRIVEGPEETAQRLREKEEHDEKVRHGKALAKFAAERKENAEGAENVVRRVAVRGRANRMRGGGRTQTREKGYYGRKGAAARAAKEAGTLRPREERIAEADAKDQLAKEQAAVLRKERKLGLARRAVDTYTTDPKYKVVYSAVAQVFADQLKKDLQALEEGKLYDISLAAKWAPSLDLSYDQHTLLCEAIARRMFPKEAHPEYADLEEHPYVYRVRDRYRKEVLAPLRQKLELPEVFMSAKRWEELPYNRVPSVAMKTYKEVFEKHDGERFKQFLEDVEAGKKKIAAGAVLPHEVLRDAIEQEGKTPNVAELQWKRMVDDLAAKGKLTNCLAVCDVSGSMSGEPMEVCIALGLLTSELCEEPWKGSVITFSSKPQIHRVTGTSLAEKHRFVQSMDWGMNTDFQAVFDQILALAVRNRLPKEKMIKRLFVFSDMEFDDARRSDVWNATPTDWQGTDYVVICKKFSDAGYGLPPDIIFWNLRDSASTPVVHDQGGVAMVSGFSKNLLKLFLQNDGDINPKLVMEQAIAGPLFQELKLVD
ncbi:hypothetical protein KC19_2G201000 [Ceratodon purpureus]|uniref:Uncharacterized protein n=1 Tax=Ceratodon purpureus TaxID=3225 RepID=A0A8T0IYV7_CERPU|nr:hypothetical protein KC19_2G201000 [Ceratodon purpureus]